MKGRRHRLQYKVRNKTNFFACKLNVVVLVVVLGIFRFIIVFDRKRWIQACKLRSSQASVPERYKRRS